MSESRPAEVLYRVQDVHKRFVSRSRRLGGARVGVNALDGVNLEIQRGETVGIVGESGCGKSTLARLLLRLDSPDSGTLEYRLGDEYRDIRSLSKRDSAQFRRRVQMVFQDPYTSLNPRERVRSTMTRPLRANGMRSAEERESRIAEALDVVGLDPEWLARFPHEFSGGQRQRICIARALVLRPELIVADEPVSSLDVSVQAQVLNLLRKVQRALSLTYVFIGHDLSVVQYMSDRIIVMNQGTIVEELRSEDLTSAQHPYTQSLLAAIPDPRSAEKRRIE